METEIKEGYCYVFDEYWIVCEYSATAGMVKWYNASLPRTSWEFDSPCPH
jgi:hypothetical protein